VLQAAWARLLTSLTDQHDVAFGTVVSGRPPEVVGAETMVGLLINTVPVRATIEPTTTTEDLLRQLQNAHNDTLEHQHVALSDIHRITGQERLFDTVFVYENYPTDTGTPPGFDGLSITGFTSRDFYHYPLTVQAGPGRELELRVQWDTDVFDAATIEALIERFRQVLVAMTAHPGRRLLAMDLPDSGRRLRLNAWGDRASQPQSSVAPVSSPEDVVAYSPPTTLIEQILAGIYAQILGVDRVGVDESFFELGGDSLSAMRAVAAINTALDEQLTVPTLFDAPSVRALSQQLGNAKLSE